MSSEIHKQVLKMALFALSPSLSACGDPCDPEQGLGDFGPPKLCNGTVRFLDHTIQLNLAAVGSSEDGDEQDDAPPKPAETTVTIEGTTEDGRPAEGFNVEVAFDKDDEDVYNLLELATAEDCRTSSRKVWCGLDMNGRATFTLRSLGVDIDGNDTSEKYALRAWSHTDAPAETVDPPGEATYWDLAEVEVGLFDIKDAQLMLTPGTRDIPPSLGRLDCVAGPCSSTPRALPLSFRLTKPNGEPLTLSTTHKVLAWIEGDSDSWIANAQVGCVGERKPNTQLEFVNSESEQAALCIGPRGGEVSLHAKLLASIPERGLPSMVPVTFNATPDISLIEVDSDVLQVSTSETEGIQLVAKYCENGAHRVASNATILVEASDGVTVGCGSDTSCQEARTNESGVLDLSVEGVAEGAASILLGAPARSGTCEVSVAVNPI